jgi:hypothetical protein
MMEPHECTGKFRTGSCGFSQYDASFRNCRPLRLHNLSRSAYTKNMELFFRILSTVSNALFALWAFGLRNTLFYRQNQLCSNACRLVG